MSSNNRSTNTDILKATVALLEAGDGNKVRMTDIAKRAGISRQAVYLHFSTRAELLIATTHYVDNVQGFDKQLIPFLNAQTGLERLDAYIDVWGNHIPVVYRIAKALLAMKDTDEEAENAWQERMHAVRGGCGTVIKGLIKDEILLPGYTLKQATDLLWTQLSFYNWEQLTVQCKWSQKAYISKMKIIARQILIVTM